RICGQPVSVEEMEGLITELDHRLFLDTERFRARWKGEIESYLNNPVRPAAHAGSAYAGEAAELREQLQGLFTCPQGPGAPSLRAPGAPGINGNGSRNGHGRLCGVLSPHIDLRRGGPSFAWAYKKVVEESEAD